MRIRTFSRFLVPALALLVASMSLQAANPAPTAITVSDMHCVMCAKKIAAKLSEVPGVATVQPNVAAAAVHVGPKPQQTLSPRALWEAVERAGYHPTRLEGPAGTFTAKPQS